MDFALFRKNPVVRINSSNSGNDAAAITLGVGNALNKAGVTKFTRTSVHCADRIVATVNSHAFLWLSAQTTPGYVFRSTSRFAATRVGSVGFLVRERFTTAVFEAALEVAIATQADPASPPPEPSRS